MESRLANSEILIEFACSSDSQLGAVAKKAGWVVHRLTREAGDLSTKKGLDLAMSVAKASPGAHLWGSLPCTTVTAIQNANLALRGASFARRLQARRRLLVKMIIHFTLVAAVVLAAGGTVTFEWPRLCHGWRLCEVQAMLKQPPFRKSLVDGCMVGVLGVNNEILFKPWSIYTTCENLATILGAFRCDGSHIHGKCCGKNAELSAFYPRRFAEIAMPALVEGSCSSKPPMTSCCQQSLPVSDGFGDFIELLKGYMDSSGSPLPAYYRSWLNDTSSSVERSPQSKRPFSSASPQNSGA